VRPTDEDQPGSRRPNLMSSSRRSSGEVNILAMLDGLGARRPARRKLRWYGAGAVLACALVGTLAWMVHDPAPLTGQPTVAEALPAPVVMAADPAPAVAPAASGGATIVNLPAVASADARPPAADTAAPAAPPAAPHEAPRAMPVPGHAPAPAPAHGAAHASKPAPVHSIGRTGVAAVHPAVHPAPKRPARANRSGAAPAAMDTDVALITAIIQHASNQHGAAQDGCADKPCDPHTPPRP
jgi:hypothetical protein